MTDQPQVFQQQTVTKLNATLLSQNVTRLLLLNKAKTTPHAPVILDLLEWAADNVPEGVEEDELGLVYRVALQNPEAVYQNLTTPEMETATTLMEAAELLLGNLSELLTDRSLPAE